MVLTFLVNKKIYNGNKPCAEQSLRLAIGKSLRS